MAAVATMGAVTVLVGTVAGPQPGGYGSAPAAPISRELSEAEMDSIAGGAIYPPYSIEERYHLECFRDPYNYNLSVKYANDCDWMSCKSGVDQECGEGSRYSNIFMVHPTKA